MTRKATWPKPTAMWWHASSAKKSRCDSSTPTSPASSNESSERGRHVTLFLSAGRKEEDGQRRQGTAADHPGTRAQQPGRQAARLPARVTARIDRGHLQV